MFDAKRLLSLLLQRFNTPLEALYQQCDSADTFIALLSGLLTETLPSREKASALRRKTGSQACIASVPAAQALGERLVRHLTPSGAWFRFCIVDVSHTHTHPPPPFPHAPLRAICSAARQRTLGRRRQGWARR